MPCRAEISRRGMLSWREQVQFTTPAGNPSKVASVSPAREPQAIARLHTRRVGGRQASLIP